jgi:hypothetical protein
MHSKLAFDTTLARNMLSRSNMDNCLADETSEGVYEYLYKVQVQIQKEPLARNMLSRSNMDHSPADETSEGVYEYL